MLIIPSCYPPIVLLSSQTMDSIHQYLLSFFFLFLAHKLYKKLTLRLPPGPRPWPILGNLYNIKPIVFRCFTEWSKCYRPIISVWFGSNLNVIVSSSELAKEVLKENDQQLADRYKSRLVDKFRKDSDGKGLVGANYGPHFVKVKAVCTTELFSSKRLEALRPTREDEMAYMVESIFNSCTSPENKGKSLVVKRYLEAAVFNNITRLVLGKRFDDMKNLKGNVQCSEFRAISTNGLKLDPSLSLTKHIPWLRWMFWALHKEDKEGMHTKDRVKIEELVKKIMGEHEVELQKNSGGAKRHHFVDALLSVKQEYDLCDDTIIGLLLDMVPMGMDTTVSVLEWAMAELMKNPRVLQKAQAELDGVVGPVRVMTEWDFSNLPYLRCIAKEALRLHPPTPLLLPHTANTQVKVGGYDIPKGSNVLVNIWALAHDPTVWKNPLEFRPERFLEEDVDLKGHDFRLLPFGSGRRACPGAQLGLNLVTSILGHLLHHFDWALEDGLQGEDIDMGESSGLMAHMRSPLQVVATPRLPEHLYKRIGVEL